MRALFARLGHELVGQLAEADLAWTTLRQPAFYRRSLGRAVSSQLPGALFLDRKDLFSKALAGFDFVPETLVVDAGVDEAEISAFLERGRAFCKSATGARGSGVRVVENPAEVGESRRAAPNEHFVLQREVAPRLWRGRKFDLRVYVLVSQGVWAEVGEKCAEGGKGGEGEKNGAGSGQMSEESEQSS